MSLSLTCDGCGAGISPQALRQGLALEHQGTHYCERCKGPILSFLRRSGVPPVALPREKAPSQAAGPLGDLEAGDLDAELDELTSRRPPPSAPPKGRSTPEPPRGPVPKPSRQPGVAGGAAAGPAGRAGSPTLGSLPSPKPGSALPRGPSAPPALPRKPGVPPAGQRPEPVPSPPGPPKGAVAAAAPVARRLPGAIPGMKVVKPAPSPEPDEGAAPRPKRRRAVILGAMGGGTGLLLLLTGILWMRSGSPEPVVALPTEKTPDARAEAVKAAEEARRKALLDDETRQFAKFRESLSDDPEKLLTLRGSLNLYVPSPGREGEHRQLLGEVERGLNAAADRVYKEILKRSAEYQKQEKFTAAGELWKGMPEIVRLTELRSKWKEEEGKAERYARAWAQWTKIDAKADKYLGQDDTEISVAILSAADNYPPNCKSLYPLIWKKRQDRINNIELNVENDRLARAEREAEREREEEEKERVRLEGERRQRWAVLVQEKPWVPLISQDASDLENWTHRSWIGTSLEDVKIPWSVQMSEGHPVIVGNNPTDQRDIEIGMNGNRWLDWVLEFEVKVESGTFALKTRTVLRGEGTFNTRVDEDSDSPKDYELAAQPGWRKMRVEAQGRKIIVFEDGVKKMEAESKERQNGGFVFALKPNSAVRIQDVRLKLIFDEKREKEESEESEN